MWSIFISTEPLISLAVQMYIGGDCLNIEKMPSSSSTQSQNE